MPSYVEALIHDEHMSLSCVMRELALTAGMALADARRERRHPGSSASYVDHVAMRATDEEKARIAREYTLID